MSDGLEFTILLKDNGEGWVSHFSPRPPTVHTCGVIYCYFDLNSRLVQDGVVILAPQASSSFSVSCSILQPERHSTGTHLLRGGQRWGVRFGTSQLLRVHLAADDTIAGCDGVLRVSVFAQSLPEEQLVSLVPSKSCFFSPCSQRD